MTRLLKRKIQNDSSLKSRFSAKQLDDINNEFEKIDGLTWHHSEDPGFFELVDEDLHRVLHTGGRSIWGGGY